MQDLIKQEQFELEVLDKLNSKKLLKSVIFCGGTMLRLCFGLNRFSADLDFWARKGLDERALFTGLKNCLGGSYEIKDAANKFHTMFFEIRSKDYPRSLKIEVRKEPKDIKTERVIAYSVYSSLQVILTVARLNELMGQKAKAFLDRKEIRDLFDMEFLLKKGVSLYGVPADVLRNVLRQMEKLTREDYATKLGSLLEAKERAYYTKENFKILKAAIAQVLQGG